MLPCRNQAQVLPPLLTASLLYSLLLSLWATVPASAQDMASDQPEPGISRATRDKVQVTLLTDRHWNINVGPALSAGMNNTNWPL